jgi:hypothetical protein
VAGATRTAHAVDDLGEIPRSTSAPTTSVATHPRTTRKRSPHRLLDQTPTFDPVEPEPVPDFDFDQSLPGDLDP